MYGLTGRGSRFHAKLPKYAPAELESADRRSATGSARGGGGARGSAEWVRGGWRHV
jgi:hypothetical protein